MLSFSGRIILLILILFIISFPLHAEKEEEIDSFVRRGLERCYQFRWVDAEEDFNQLIKKYPDDPRGYHYKSGIYLWYYLSSNNKIDFQQFIKYSDLALKKGEEILEQKPDDEKINYTLGNAYSYRTLGYAKSESYLNAIWSSKKSEKHLNTVITKNPAMYDAYLGLGLYNFAAAQIPAAFKWALSLAGISGDEETGIKYIKIASEKGTISKVEAQYYLSQLYSGVLLEYREAGDLLKVLSAKYPSNILFNYAYAVVQIKLRNPKEAEKILTNIIKQRYPKFSQVISFSHFLLGDVNFRENNFKKAIIYYKNFLKGTVGKDYTGIAFLRLGLSNELDLNRQAAIEFYNKAAGGNPDIEDDLYARTKSESYKKRPITEKEIQLLKYFNMVESGKYTEAIKGLSSILPEINDLVYKAETLYYLSEALYETGMPEESINYALQGGSIDTGDNGWINAFCYYNAAKASKKMGRYKLMKDYMELADDQDNQVYSNLIDNMLSSLER